MPFVKYNTPPSNPVASDRLTAASKVCSEGVAMLAFHPARLSDPADGIHFSHARMVWARQYAGIAVDIQRHRILGETFKSHGQLKSFRLTYPATFASTYKPIAAHLSQ